MSKVHGKTSDSATMLNIQPLTANIPKTTDDGKTFIRLFTGSDHPALVKILSQPVIWEQGFGDGPDSQPATDQATLHFIQDEIDIPQRIVFALLDEQHNFIGIASYYLIQPENARVEIGKIILDPTVWGQGRMIDTLKTLLRHAFKAGYHRVQAESDVTNQRSINTLQRAGFQLEGTRRHSSFHADGSRRDISIFSVTLSDIQVLKNLGV